MIHRYDGNTGRMTLLPEPGDLPPPPPYIPPAPERPMRPPPPGPPPFQPFDRLLASLGALETEDLLLALVLWLLYRESGDVELLIILGALFLL